MIKNEREFRITKAQVEKFERALADHSASGGDPLPKAQREAIQSQLQELQEQIAKYEGLRLRRRSP